MNAFWLHNYINSVLFLIGSCCITKGGLNLGTFLFQLPSVPPPAYQCFHYEAERNLNNLMAFYSDLDLKTW